MAKDYLPIQVSSVASEKRSSSGKRTVHDDKARLTPDTIQAIDCLKSWIQ